MKTNSLIAICCIVMFYSCKTDKRVEADSPLEANSSIQLENEVQESAPLTIFPISHATMVLQYGDHLIYVDPTGGAEAFGEFKAPKIVLITDIHGDHFDIKTLQALDLKSSTIIAPKAVVDKLPQDFSSGKLIVMNNGDIKTIAGHLIEAIPMYNLREEALKFHSKGRGNGYVLTLGDERIYISGDTEDIPEMRSLEDIDKAFICMNLPYTMPVESAADAVLEFKPKTVYPYHYRGTEGLSDVEKFKTLVLQGNESIEVVQLEWYK